MIIQMDALMRQLAASGEAIRVLLETIPDEQARWQPNAETWSLLRVMEHMLNEERLDFRRHLREMLGDPPQAWGPYPEEEVEHVESLGQALAGFSAERNSSLAWLKALAAPDWDRTTVAPWGTISAGDVLVSWVEHDYLHLRQMNELLHAWNEQQAAPYSVRYAGGW